MKKHRLFFIIASIIFIAFYLFDHIAYEYYLRNFDVFFSNFYRQTFIALQSSVDLLFSLHYGVIISFLYLNVSSKKDMIISNYVFFGEPIFKRLSFFFHPTDLSY